MKAAVATENGLALRDIPQPRPKPNEVLVTVRAAALNRADLATARGLPHGSHGGIGAAARTFTSTSLGFGRGCGMSRSSSPFSVATAAFISFSVGCFVERRGGRKRGLLCPGRGLSRVRRPPVGSTLRPPVLHAQVGAAVYMRARPRVLSSSKTP